MGFKPEYKIQSLFFFSCGLNCYIFNNKNKKAFIVNLSKTKPLPIEFLIVQKKNIKIKVLPMEGFCVPKDAHFQFQKFLHQKEKSKATVSLQTKQQNNKQIAAKFSSSFPRILLQCRIFYIHRIIS